MVTEDLTFELELDPSWSAIAEPLDAAAGETLRRLFTDAAPERIAVRVAPSETADVSGHAVMGATIDVLLTAGDDVEGHAFTLHFPSSADAQRMRMRLAAGGLLIAALTVGSIGVAGQVAAPQAGTGAPAQAVAAAAAVPIVNAGLSVSPALKADLRDGDLNREETVAAPVPRLNITQKN
jgi:hypothetical protein